MNDLARKSRLASQAKKNTFLMMATQSLDEVAKSDIFATIVDNVPNRIFLANGEAKAHTDMYRGKFGLNTAQIDRIRLAMPKRHYYIVTRHMSRMVEVVFPNEILSCLRSDARAQAVFLKHHGSGDANWRDNYLLEMRNE